MNVGEKIEKCLFENGIDIDENGNMRDVDSLDFIGAIIALEEVFNIEFPDWFLNYELLHNKEQIEEMIVSLLENKTYSGDKND